MDDTNKCTKCAAGFFLRKTDSQCITPNNVVANCVEYDDQIVNCVKCDTGRYLLRNLCPLYYQTVNPGTSALEPADPTVANATFAIPGCYEYSKKDNTTNSCKNCDPTKETYLTNNNMNCCAFNTFYNTTTSACEATNGFPNCKKYSTNSTTDCLECNKGYFLAILKDGMKRCVKFSTPDQECLVSETGIYQNTATL